LIELYKKNDFEFGKLTRRILSKLAIVFLTANYLQKCFPEIGIDLKAIVKFIVDLERSVADERDISDKALDCIIQYVSTHKSAFIIDCNENYLSRIEGKISKTGITILKCVVEKILSENGFEAPKMIYKRWQDKGIIECERDRPYKRKKLAVNLPIQPIFIFDLSKYNN